MSGILVFDIEANGLLDTVTEVHCICIKEVGSNSMMSYGPDRLDEAIEYLSEGDLLIAQNGVGYDFPAMEKLFNYKRPPNHKIFDTFVASMLLNPNRKMPFNCPAWWIGEDGVRHKIGPHSLAAWGYRVGRGKVVHEDWSVFTPEMLHRCEEDVLITEQVFLALLKEMGLTPEDL